MYTLSLATTLPADSGSLMRTHCFRISRGLPLELRWGSTRWRILLDFYGKQGQRAALLAKCLTDGRTEEFGVDGRESWVLNAVRNGVYVREGTIAFELLDQMQRVGAAEKVNPSGLPT